MAVPDDIPRQFKCKLSLAQHGDAKVLNGFGGADVLEVMEDDSSGTYRPAYADQLAEAVFVRHCFKKEYAWHRHAAREH